MQYDVIPLIRDRTKDAIFQWGWVCKHSKRLIRVGGNNNLIKFMRHTTGSKLHAIGSTQDVFDGCIGDDSIRKSSSKRPEVLTRTTINNPPLWAVLHAE